MKKYILFLFTFLFLVSFERVSSGREDTDRKASVLTVLSILFHDSGQTIQREFLSAVNDQYADQGKCKPKEWETWDLCNANCHGEHVCWPCKGDKGPAWECGNPELSLFGE